MQTTNRHGGLPGASPHPFVPRIYVKEPIRWEYRALPFDGDPPAEEALNALGDDGWELVTALPQALYFKRLVE